MKSRRGYVERGAKELNEKATTEIKNEIRKKEHCNCEMKHGASYLRERLKGKEKDKKLTEKCKFTKEKRNGSYELFELETLNELRLEVTRENNMRFVRK